MASTVAQLPSTYKFGTSESAPVVSIDECRAHLVLLARFYELRQAVETKSTATGAFETYVRGAVGRFYDWANAKNRSKLPTLDVAMVWHAFMLNPVSFAHDVHRLPALADLDSFPLLEVAQKKESIDSLAAIETASTIEPPFGIDVAAAVLRQAGFIKDVVEFGWTKDVDTKIKFFVRCINRYHGFLDILRARPDAPIAPTMDIDLAWHTHQLKGKTYRQDTIRITGRMVNHNDNVEEEKLEDSYNTTSDIWKEHFGVPYDPADITEAEAGLKCMRCDTSAAGKCMRCDTSAAGKCMRCDTSVAGKCMRCDSSAAGKCMRCDTSAAAAGKCMRCDTSVAGKETPLKCMRCDTSAAAAGKCMRCDTSAKVTLKCMRCDTSAAAAGKCMRCDTSAVHNHDKTAAGKCMRCDTSATTEEVMLTLKCMRCDTSAATCKDNAESCGACGLDVSLPVIAV